MVEIYPLGGAADRLHLVDEKTKKELPAAKLCFMGKILFQRLIEDVQGREYLHYKLFGKQLITPLGIMSSNEKDNHYHILSICKEKDWFGRPRDSFYFFIQPLAPAISEKGNWCMKNSLIRRFPPTHKPGDCCPPESLSPQPQQWL